MANTVNLLLAGVGGQGTVLAARLAAGAAMRGGLEVRGSETIGMAQRGGSVTSHVRMSGGSISSPLIPKRSAHLIIAFEPGEAQRAVNYLAPGATLICSDRAVMPSVRGDYDPQAALSYLRSLADPVHILPADDIEAACGIKSLNVALLSYATTLGLLPFDIRALEEELTAAPARYAAQNAAALSWGKEFR